MIEMKKQSLSEKIEGSHFGFTYGSYQIDSLTNSQILGYSSPPAGYEVLGLPDGRISITPPPKGGWLQIKDILLGTRDEEFCCDDSSEESLFDMKLIRDQVIESYKNAVDDPRLNYNPRTIPEPPYSRILGRMNLASKVVTPCFDSAYAEVIPCSTWVLKGTYNILFMSGSKI